MTAGRRAVTFETRPWGGFSTLEEGPGYKVKRLVVEPGHRFSLQKHRHRAEHWVVVTGRPRVTIAGRARRLRPRQSVTVPRGAWHRAENPGRVPVVIIEVQHGSYLGEDDIVRRQDDYGRTGTPPAPRRGPQTTGAGVVPASGPARRGTP
ncbi:MAG: hypothetical protein A2X52_16575 [Candidatus Rokubacteria bacterium GWC2_70_16]|nr:MAG: hypothetical protein A2X52_16575 [Candidatus Rokubacteria bacterium GWC2_70_16]